MMQLNAIKHSRPHALQATALAWVRTTLCSRSKKATFSSKVGLLVRRSQYCMFLSRCPFNDCPKARWSTTKRFSENLSTFKKKTTILKSKWHSNKVCFSKVHNLVPELLTMKREKEQQQRACAQDHHRITLPIMRCPHAARTGHFGRQLAALQAAPPATHWSEQSLTSGRNKSLRAFKSAQRPSNSAVKRCKSRALFRCAASLFS